MGKGGTCDRLPCGPDVTIGGFSKDLKNFVIWPGRTKDMVDDRATPSFKDAALNTARCVNSVQIWQKSRSGM
jgi:hypothetical protein